MLEFLDNFQYVFPGLNFVNIPLPDIFLLDINRRTDHRYNEAFDTFSCHSVKGVKRLIHILNSFVRK